jgi:hypothetical protein
MQHDLEEKSTGIKKSLRGDFPYIIHIKQIFYIGLPQTIFGVIDWRKSRDTVSLNDNCDFRFRNNRLLMYRYRN